MSSISLFLPSPPDNFSTTLSSAINTSALTIPLNSVSGLGTEGVGVLFKKDSNGDVIAGSVEFIHWTNVSGSNLTLSDVGDRGLTGSDSGAQSYASGDYFEVWVSSYYYAGEGALVEHGQDGKHTFSGLTAKTTPVDADLVPLVDSAASNVLKKLTWANLKATLKTYLDTLYPPQTGWIPYSAVIPTRASADDPTYVLTFAGVDLTSTISVGMKVKWTQNSTVRYGIVTAIAFSTDTTLTLYGGTDYDVDDTATFAISAFYFSTMKAPLGFPLDPTKWTEETTDTATTSQASPSQNVWYNINSFNLVIPIGCWNVEYSASIRPTYSSQTGANQYVTLSTANNSESDADFTNRLECGGAVGNQNINTVVYRRKIVTLISKTTHYLNHKTDNGTQTSINLSSASPLPKSIIRAVCAYL